MHLFIVIFELEHFTKQLKYFLTLWEKSLFLIQAVLLIEFDPIY